MLTPVMLCRCRILPTACPAPANFTSTAPCPPLAGTRTLPGARPGARWLRRWGWLAIAEERPGRAELAAAAAAAALARARRSDPATPGLDAAGS